MIRDYSKLAFKNLRHRKLRSWLTILGIVISVMSIVALISVSNGLENAIEEQFEKIGANRIYVMMKGGAPGTTTGLTTKDVETLENMGEFVYITPYLVESSVKITYGKEDLYASITAWPADDADKRFVDYDFDFLEGRHFRDGARYEVIVGYLTAKDFFKKDIGVNNNVLINEVKFDIVGIFDEIGNEQDDRIILIPLETAREIFGKEKEVSFIEATLKQGKNIDQVVEKTKKRLERERDDESFD